MGKRRWLGAALLLLLGLAALGAGPQRREGTFQRGTLAGRVYRLYVPHVVQEAPSGAPALPLVVALHGCWQTPEDFALGTRLNDAAERRGLLVLYPAQGRRDNASRCWNWFEPVSRERGEVGEILVLIQHVGREQRVDPSRVVVLGLSAGGFMAINLACAAPDVVSRLGLTAGGPYRCGIGLTAAIGCMRGHQLSGEASARACRETMGPRARSIRASLWHGAEDAVVNPSNLEALAVMFSRLNGMVSPTTETRDSATHAVYRDAAGRLSFETWLVAGMGHAWSGGDIRGTHTYPPGPNATERMLDVLLEPAGEK